MSTTMQHGWIQPASRKATVVTGTVKINQSKLVKVELFSTTDMQLLMEPTEARNFARALLVEADNAERAA